VCVEVWGGILGETERVAEVKEGRTLGGEKHLILALKHIVCENKYLWPAMCEKREEEDKMGKRV